MKNATKGLLAGAAGLMALAITTIGGFEGLELKAYPDIVGVWTVCYGETNGVKPGDTYTKAECDQQLAKQIKVYEGYVDSCLTATVPGKTKVAMVSLTYNIGKGAFCKSTVLKRANAGDLKGSCDAFMMWNKAGGRVIKGLTARREKERTLCLAGVKEGV